MTRKLLPYEHQLVQHLNVTEEEYLEFLAAQRDHSLSLQERESIIRADVATVALVLTIVGTLLQVAAALLAPKPSRQGGRQTREQVFAPRTGFNSAQELAKYGDPVNLIYANTDDNPNGGVRVASSLIWSAIYSEGSSQFMQMMLVLGAGYIDPAGIDSRRIAFGQTPVRQFVTQRTWTYFSSNSFLTFNNLIAGDASDPLRIGAANHSLVYQVNPLGREKAEGFSQAFSPTTLTKCGVHFPIPININIYDRKDNGGLEGALNGITVDSAFLNTYWSRAGKRPIIEPGVRFTMTFEMSFISRNRKQEIYQTAAELRRNLFGGIDAGSVYKLGSAKFRIASPIPSSDLDAGSISVTFECIERGSCPEDDYETTDYKQNEEDASDAILFYQRRNIVLQELLLGNAPIFDATDIAAGLLDRYNYISLRLAALVDYEEDGNKVKNFSEIDDNPIYPQEIRSIVQTIDSYEQIIEDAVNDKKNKKQVKKYTKEIRRLEKQLRRLFIDYYDGNYKRTRKERLAEIENLRREVAQFVADHAGKFDQAAMDARNEAWRQEIAQNNLEITRNQRILDDPENWNDYFHTKCLVKIEEASYETITQCNIVDFALRARVFKRVSGRARRYGEKKEPTFKSSDNGTKTRVSMFWLLYRRTGSTSWTRVNHVFAIRRGTDVDNYISLKFRANDNNGNWQFHFEPIAETASEMREFGFASFAYIENNGSTVAINNPDGTQISFIGFTRAADFDLPPLNNNPSQIDEWSLFSARSDTSLQFSFDNGPEIEIKAVTEQRAEALSVYPNLYKNLALLGFNAYSGQGVQDVRSITAFVNKGRWVRRLTDEGTYPAEPDGPTSYAPDIFLDTIIDPIDGIGLYAKVAGIDLSALALAKRFCKRNQLFMDCVIADQRSWRQFWSEVALFSLLELGRIGGKETLVPAVPCDNAGNITRQVSVSALFNAGNILEDSFKEEFIDYGTNVQDLLATVIYRATEQDGVFPRNSSVEVSIKGTTEGTAVRQTFDLSQFVTNRNQAILFGKLLCNQRRYLRKIIEFKTFSTDSPLSPGAYIYVDIGQMEWNNIHSGVVGLNGQLNTPIKQPVPRGNYSVLLYKSGQPIVQLSGITIMRNTASALSSYQDWLFVLGNAVKTKRVFRVSEVQMDEEGEVSVKAIEHPCDDNGDSLIANFDDAFFEVR